MEFWKSSEFHPPTTPLIQTPKMLIAALRIKVLPQKRNEVLELLEFILEPIQVEPGCLSCHLLQDVREADVLIFEEVWRNQGDLERHIRSEKYRNILAAMDMASEAPEIRFNAVSHTAGMEVIHAVRGP